MPSLTAADMASRTMRKGWVDRTAKEDDQIEAQEARESAAKTTRRPYEPMVVKRRKSPLYEKADKPEED